jgi:chromatin assembly factor 1 subunit A
MEVTESIKLPQLTKGLRYYYRHRDELSAARRERQMHDPEYQAKQAAKEEAKRAKEEAKQKVKEEAKEAKEAKEKAKKEEAQRIKDEKRKIKEQLLGIRPV